MEIVYHRRSQGRFFMAVHRPAGLDLSTVDGHERAALWMRSAGRFFPGVSVTRPPANPLAGMIDGVPLGAGWLWNVLSPAVSVSYLPVERSDAQPLFSVMLQLEGTTSASQGSRICKLNPGDFCVIDGVVPFHLEVAEPSSRVVFVQMPRHAVLSRRGELEHCTAQRFDTSEAGSLLLRNMLSNLLDVAPYLAPEQRAAALAAVVQLLATPKLPAGAPEGGRDGERIVSTLAFIDAQLADPSLNAHRVASAQGLSRRRLDQILLGSLGTSLTAQIWMRRLTQAASDLLDARFATKTVTQIAFGVGFEDAAHFARAFRRRYHCTPSEWRQRNMLLDL
jgi:AraC-like DNA-binding protein